MLTIRSITTRTALLIGLGIGLPAQAWSGPGSNDDQEILISRPVAPRPAYRPDLPKSPHTTGIEVSQEEGINEALAGVRAFKDESMLSGQVVSHFASGGGSLVGNASADAVTGSMAASGLIGGNGGGSGGATAGVGQTIDRAFSPLSGLNR
ncbi:hypothetical protein [Crenobacter cavernae]|uniref:DUF4148 domain-containing protein n=1 Tax=Crenobacter cavernae TaxID=2290923 RepID=A0ABY0FF60_9NEIS|nr:hypothetical protein [Crenobacter cavernae]RXZ44932.1 hypothetical protein EBB06_03305 [Crenobacter cavernae]